MARTLRTRFKREIVAEFLPPHVSLKRRKGVRKMKERVVIICDGMPSVPSKSSLVEFFSKKGFWVIYPRYRGSWESDGIFLKQSPEQDVLDIIDELPKGFKDLWSGETYRVKSDNIFIIVSSFGGPAGILASRDPRVKKVVAISPVVDWQAPSDAEPLDARGLRMIRDAFGNGYRFGKKEWAKLASGTFYNPTNHIKEIDGSKLFIFHAKDDESVRWNEVAKFAHATKARLKLFKNGGHLRSGRIVQKYWHQISKFLK